MSLGRGTPSLAAPTKCCPDADPRARAHDPDERLADALVHAIGAAAALAGACILLLAAASRGWGVILPTGVYALGLVVTFAASAAYNLAYDTQLRALLRRLDHSAIFVMIAATYTPFTARFAPGSLALWATLAAWVFAASGIGLKLGNPALFERIGVAIYLALGWSALAIISPIARALPFWALALLAAGGLLYTIGVCFHLMQRLRFHNAIWHCFVLVAASCHFTSILGAVVLR